MPDLSASVPFTALDRDLWPLVKDADAGLGAAATDDRGRRFVVTVDKASGGLLGMVLSPTGRTVACYHVQVAHMVGAFSTVAAMHRAA